jgi:prepilin signal peptidase PulO-like enzyme (type II secretory pathway)
MDERDAAADDSEATPDEMAEPPMPSSPAEPATAQAAEPPRTSPIVWLLAGATVLLVAAFFFVEPALSLLQTKPALPLRRFEGATLSEVVLQRSFEALTVAWFFMLGASFGSFLHCLEYRMPRGISIVARGSCCPGCGTPIRMWHNVPVLGWLMLRGRCAACGWAIPARYAFTEFVFGLAFALLMVVELVGGGINLPLRPWPAHVGMVWNLWTPKWDLISIYAYHAAFVTLLMTWCLFACDRLRVPRRLLFCALLIGMVAPVVRPQLHPLRWDEGQHLLSFLGPQAEALANVAVGAIAGLVVGALMMRRTGGNVRHGDANTTLSGATLVGVFLGWQATVGIALLATSFRWLAVISPARRWPVVVWITLATLLHLTAWRWLYEQPFWPGHAGAWGTLLMAAAIVAIGSWLLDRYERGGDAGPPLLQPAFPEVSSCAATSAEQNEMPHECKVAIAEPEQEW